MDTLSAFIAHDPADAPFLEELLKRLRSLRRTARLSLEPLRSAADLPAGADDALLQQWILEADVLIILLSADFNVSHFAESTDPDFIKLFQARLAQGALLIPIMARPVDATWIFDGVPDPPTLLPNNSISISQMDPDLAWNTVTQGVRELAANLLRRREHEQNLLRELENLERRVSHLEKAIYARPNNPEPA